MHKYDTWLITTRNLWKVPCWFSFANDEFGFCCSGARKIRIVTYCHIRKVHFIGLNQTRHDSIANSLDLHILCIKPGISLQIVFDNNVDAAQARSLVMTSFSCSYYISMECASVEPTALGWTTYYGGLRDILFLEGTYCTDGEADVYMSLNGLHESKLYT